MGNIIVHGQNLNLERCGGAGRYSAQLYNRFRAMQDANLTEHHFFFPGFRGIVPSDDVTRKKAQTAIANLKRMVNRSFPPFLYDYLLRVYTALVRSELSSSRLSYIPEVSDWHQCTVPTIFHELTNYGVSDLLGRMTLFSRCKLVVTFLDIQDLFYPEYFSDKILLNRRLAYSFFKDRAHLFFAISNFTKQTMIDRLEIPEDRIIVTPLAADDQIFETSSEDMVSSEPSLSRYWLYPAKAWKHKNHDLLLKAMSILQHSCRSNSIKLVLTGGFSKEEFSYLQRLVVGYGVEDLVEVLGFVSDRQLKSLMRGAEFMIFPSLFEGFGLPILEAMSIGCPVLSSKSGSLPEVGGDAAYYFDTQNEESLVSILESIINGSGPDKEQMISKGFNNCKRFSWDNTFRKTVEGYQMLTD